MIVDKGGRRGDMYKEELRTDIMYVGESIQDVGEQTVGETTGYQKEDFHDHEHEKECPFWRSKKAHLIEKWLFSLEQAWQLIFVVLSLYLKMFGKG